MKWSLCCLVATVVGVAQSQTARKIIRAPHQPTSNGTQPLTFNDVLSGDLYAEVKSFNWVQDSKLEGWHVKLSNGSLVMEDVVSQRQEILIPATQVPKEVTGFWFNHNVTTILWATNRRKLWRYSFFADYFVQDVRTKGITPLAIDQKNDIQYAVISPSSTHDTIAYVRGNNIFLWKDGKTTQLTNTGGPNMFHGIPDWVYEEEILGTNYALWFNEEGNKMVYLSINETGVQSYRVQYWLNEKNDGSGSQELPPYPRELDIRYPKAGTRNPTITASLVSCDFGPEGPKPVSIPINEYPPDELIIGEVAWLGKRVAFRLFDRIQSQSKLYIYDTPSNTFKIARSQDGSDGWIDNNKSIKYVGVLSGANGKEFWGQNGCCEEYYLDKTDLSNWDHFYLMPTNYFNNDPIPLSWGNYDVRDILHIDPVRHKAYYTSTEVHPTDSHIYSISLKTLERQNLTDTSKHSFTTASFTPNGAYYVLTYKGPNIPYQELYSANDTSKPIRTITENKALIDKLAKYKLPRIRYADLQNPLGLNLSSMMRYPANFDPSKKYPILFTPYGGPGAQEVSREMQALDFKSYVSSDPELEYITFTLDNRGTGFRGREFRASVARHLGQLEAEDQIWAAQYLVRTNAFIDRNKIAIWGWSYGGYLSAKVVEANSDVFSMGMLTAPVSDWRLYDSMYTERFMGLPSANSKNYSTTAVKRADGFKKIKGGVLMQHGTGDDNVHFQNSAALVDVLMVGGVGPDKLQVQYFTDSDHSISNNGANRFVYRQLAQKLFEEKLRTGDGKEAHQWSERTNPERRSSSGDAKQNAIEKFMRKLDEGHQDVIDKERRMLLPGQKRISLGAQI